MLMMCLMVGARNRNMATWSLAEPLWQLNESILRQTLPRTTVILRGLAEKKRRRKPTGKL